MNNNNKIGIITHSTASIATINLLWQHQQLAGVCLLSSCPQAVEFEAFMQQNNIPYIVTEPQNTDKIATALSAWQCLFALDLFSAMPHGDDLNHIKLYRINIGNWCADSVETCLFHLLSQGFVFSELTLSESQSNSLINTHPFDISNNETLGGLIQQLSTQILPELVFNFLQNIAGLTAKMEGAERAHKSLQPLQQSDLLINFQHMHAEQIKNKARAANPLYGGAQLQVQGQIIQILQASTGNWPTFGAKAGTILTVCPNQGLIIALEKDAVRLDILANSNGIFNGYRFALNTGLQAGMKLK